MQLTEGLCNAYLTTKFLVFPPGREIRLHAEGSSDELEALHATYGVNCSALITAYNPYSEVTENAVNQANQLKLIADISERWRYLLGEGADPEGGFPVEPSILVLGISLAKALELGRNHGQHAILFSDQINTRLYACDPDKQPIVMRAVGAFDRPVASER